MASSLRRQQLLFTKGSGKGSYTFASFWPLHPMHLQPFSPKRLLLKFVIHLKYCSWIPGVFIFGLIVSCNKGTSSDEKREGLELVSVDLSKSRSGKLSEFFEAEAE